MKYFSTLLTLIMLAICAFASPANAQVIRDGATTLLFKNTYNSDVVVFVTVPALPCAAPCIQGDGCPTGTVANLRYIDITAGAQPAPLVQFGTPSQGWFILKAGRQAQLLNVGLNPITRQVSSCFQGVKIGFGQIGNQCPDVGTAYTAFPNTTPGPQFNNPVNPPIKLPNGSNSFECTINLPGTAGGATSVGGKAVPVAEATDISCVNGANSLLSVTLTPPAGGPYWNTLLATAQGGFKYFTSTTTFGPNSWVDIAKRKDDNCVDPRTGWARPGIYPYGCSWCNNYPDPAPPCTSAPVAQICAAKNGLPTPAGGQGCLFNRSPLVSGIQRFGGTMLVTYHGPAVPPP